jgi:hypothetical protein
LAFVAKIKERIVGVAQPAENQIKIRSAALGFNSGLRQYHYREIHANTIQIAAGERRSF